VKVFVIMWHWIESDGVSGVFLTRAEAEQHISKAAGKEGSASVHEIEIGKFYEDADFPKGDFVH